MTTVKSSHTEGRTGLRETPRFPSPGSPFKPGQRITGNLLGTLEDGRVIVSSEGKAFAAVTQTPLAQGVPHRFQVVSTTPRIHLKVLGKETLDTPSSLQIWNSTRGLKERLAGIFKEITEFTDRKDLPQGARSPLEALAKVLSEVLYSPDKADGGRLFRVLASCGIFWEQKVAAHLLRKTLSGPQGFELEGDLKGALLSLLKGLEGESAGGKGIESLMERLRDLLQMVEKDQQLNLALLREGLGGYGFIPGEGEKGFRKGELFLRKGGNPEGLFLSLSLDFTSLGRMDVNLSLIESSLDIHFFMEDEASALLVRENLSFLEGVLRGTGLEVRGLTCGIRDPEGVLPFPSGDAASSSIHVIM
jgi:hypothetical protein